MGDHLWAGKPPQYFTQNHLGQLSLLSLAGWEMNTDQSAATICSWGLKAGTLTCHTWVPKGWVAHNKHYTKRLPLFWNFLQQHVLARSFNILPSLPWLQLSSTLVAGLWRSAAQRASAWSGRSSCCWISRRSSHATRTVILTLLTAAQRKIHRHCGESYTALEVARYGTLRHAGTSSFCLIPYHNLSDKYHTGMLNGQCGHSACKCKDVAFEMIVPIKRLKFVKRFVKAWATVGIQWYLFAPFFLNPHGKGLL